MSAPSSSEDVFPRRFGRYMLLAPLARGGMGSLFLAYQGDQGMEKLCVVKTVLPQLADHEYVARFRDEAKVVVQLSHGNLVPVFDAGQASGELYIAMDFVDGKDLRAVWNRCARKAIAFPVDVAVHIVRELVRGLHHAHNFGDLHLVHRDVSPPNVLLGFSGEIKLTDFGLASSVIKMEKTAPGVVYGKVSYMSPEQVRGEPLDGRTDQYAAAIILWELLTGRQLFPSSDPHVIDHVRDPHIDPPSKRAGRVSPKLDAIVMKALSRNKQDRYADCEAFRAALAEFLAKEAPATDSARVATFLRELFTGEIEEERRKRQQLIEQSRHVSPERAKGALPVAPLEPPDPASSSGIVNTVLGGRYQVVRVVGEGGMGRVYEAEHTEIGKRVAIKLIHPGYSRTPELVERFRREARAASRIGHPNIVDVTDSGKTEAGSVFFVMEFLEGCDLSQAIRTDKRLSVDRAVNVAIQLSRALEAAHAAGIIHRDLKPENVYLIDRPGQKDFVKVLDFGIAQQADLEGVNEGRLTDPGLAMGTPEYMAPEQATGQKIDERVDVYSVGAILYEMLAGKPPHEGASLMEVISKKTSEAPPLLSTVRSDVGAELAQLVAKALMPHREDRPASMAEVASTLERCRPDRRSRGRPAVVEAPAAAAPTVPAASPSTSSAIAPSSKSVARRRRPNRDTKVLALAFVAASLLLLGIVTLLVLGGEHHAAQLPPAAALPAAHSQR